MQSMLATRKRNHFKFTFCNEILSLQYLFQLSPMNFHYYFSEMN